MLKGTIALVILTVSSSVLANSFDKGLNYYRTANFVQAKVEFQNALRAGSNRSGYGKIYKYLGLSQYMLGETKEAKASFGYALHYDPSVELYPNEVLDSSVLEFFLNIKQKVKVSASPPKRAKIPVASKAKKRPATVVKSPPPANKSKLGTSRKPKRALAKKKPPVRQKTNKKVVSRSRNTAKKAASKHAHPRAAKKQAKHPRSTVAKNKKQQNMFSAKKPPQVIILDSGGNNVKKQSKKRMPRAYQDLLPVPSSKISSVRVRGGISAWSFLPFGAGQYAAGRYKTGHLFAIASIGALVTAGGFYWASLEQQGKREKAIEDIKKCHAGSLPPCSSEKNKEKVLKILTKSEFDLGNDVDMNNIGIWSGVGAFGALWIGGIIEAVVNRSVPISYVSFDRESVTLAFNYHL